MSNRLYEKYEDKLPQELLDASGDNYAGGLIRLCDPDSYVSILSDGYSEQNTVIFATTAFGDFLCWEKGKYVTLVSFSQHKTTVLESGFEFFFEDIGDENFLKKYFQHDLFLTAVRKIGECKDDECFTSAPIPFIGGAPTIENLKIGKLKEYNAISIDLAGKLL